MAKTYKFGIVGCGVIAPSHVEAIKGIKNAQLYAVCDIIKEKADKFAKTHSALKVYYDYSEMLQDKEIDIVCICTPSGMHGDMTIAAARAEKHIICEKPIEIKEEKLNEVVEELKKHKVKMTGVFQRRTHPVSLKVKKALDEGIFGKVLVADAYLKYYRSPDYYKSAGWRATWELDGGGALMNQGVHGVDLISWFMGGVESLYAVCRTQLHSIDVEDTALVVVNYKNGAVGVIEGTTCVNPGQQTRFEIHCEKGSIIFDDSGIVSWYLNGVEEAEKASKDLNTGSDALSALAGLSHQPIFEKLIYAIENDVATFVPAEEGRKPVDTILAIYKSSKEGRKIVL